MRSNGRGLRDVIELTTVGCVDKPLLFNDEVCRLDRVRVRLGTSGGVKATAVLTHDGVVPTDDIAATATLTSDNDNTLDGASVTIGTKVYVFRAVVAVEGDVLVSAVDADGSLTNLINAINHTGNPGVDYVCAAEHPDVSAGVLGVHEFTVTAKVPGGAGNLIAKAEDSAHLDWDGVGGFLTGGADAETVTIGTKVYTFRAVLAVPEVEGEVLIAANADDTLTNLVNAINHEGNPGVDYSCAAAHPLVSASAVAAQATTVTARVAGLDGDLIAKAETSAHLDWDGVGATLTGGGDLIVGLVRYTPGVPIPVLLADPINLSNGDNTNFDVGLVAAERIMPDESWIELAVAGVPTQLAGTSIFVLRRRMGGVM